MGDPALNAIGTRAVEGAGDALESTSSARAGARSRRLSAIRPLSFAILPALLVLPGLSVGPSLDAAVFVLTGARLRGGALPYRDVWDHKPPAIYLFNAASQLVLPFADPWLLAWACSLAATIATVLLLDALLRGRGSARWSWGWSAAAAVLISAFPVALGGAHTESFAVLPLVAALVLVVTRAGSVGVAAVVGLLLAVAGLFSLLAAPAAAAIGLAALVSANPARPGSRLPFDLREAAWRLVALAAGAAPLPLLVLGWLAATGALADAYDQLVAYGGAYHASRGALGPALLAPAWLYLFTLPFLVAGLYRLARLAREGRRIDATAGTALVWLAGFVAFVALEGRIYLHYTILVVPPVAVLGMEGASWLAGTLAAADRGRRLRGAIVALDAALLLAVSLGGLGWLTAYQYGNSADWRPRAEALAARVREIVPAGSPIFVWGDNTDLYLLADRPPATRFIYQLPMVTPTYWSAERTRELVSELAARPPAAIVETESGVLFDRGKEPADCKCGDTRHYDTLDPLRAFVASRYRVGAVVDGLRIFVPVAP